MLMDKNSIMKTFLESELIINEDGSIFHLHLKPEQLADRVILCGDPNRVDAIASHFDFVLLAIQISVKNGYQKYLILF